jgi:hypothetical protein
MSVAGKWNLVIVTPIGKQAVVLELRETGDGGIAGVAVGSAETTALLEARLDGDTLTWRQAITRPMRLNLAFEVTIAGDTMQGIAKAGRLPGSKVTGTRLSGVA